MRLKKKFLPVLFALLIIVIVVSFASTLKIAKTPEDIINYLQQELHTSTKDSNISYIDNFMLNEKALLWFSIEKPYSTDYRAVECQPLKNSKYRVIKIHKPMSYSQNIVHTIWMGEDIFLICDPNCQSIVYKNKSDEIISKIDLSPKDIPYVFSDNRPASAVKLDFLDVEGKNIH